MLLSKSIAFRLNPFDNDPYRMPFDFPVHTAIYKKTMAVSVATGATGDVAIKLFYNGSGACI